MEREEITELVREVMRGEFTQYLRDIEFRVAQAYDVAKRTTTGAIQKIYAEDLGFGLALTGYTVTNNSPSAGDIAWASLHVVYNGTDNTITDGNTANQYVWWDPAVSSTVLQTSSSKPTLSNAAALIFINNSGTAIVAVGNSLPPAIGNTSVDAAAIINGAVGSSALASSAVTSGKIASGAVGSAALGASAVTSAAIASGAVTSAALGTGAVTSTAIASGAVTSAAIGAGAVTNAALGTGAVGATNLNILQHVLY